MSKTILIDAGHGGSDPGAVNKTRCEKNANLDIAMKLGTKLQKQGFKVVYSRKTDVTKTLLERVTVSNSVKADFFISIHCNSASNKTAAGIESWVYQGVGGITRRLANNVQKQLASIEGVKNRGVKDGTFYVLKRTICPALLVECGFISNSQECEKLFDSDYQNELAEKICKGVLDTIK